MPYISSDRRDELDEERAGGSEPVPESPGELNYEICRLIDAYISEHGLRYRTLNDVMGVLESVKQELYRRIVGPYEDGKIEENGDVPLFEDRP